MRIHRHRPACQSRVEDTLAVLRPTPGRASEPHVSSEPLRRIRSAISRGSDDVLAFAVEQSNCADVFLETGFASFRIAGCVATGNTFFRRLVDTDIGCLCRQHNAISNSNGFEYTSSVLGSD